MEAVKPKTPPAPAWQDELDLLRRPAGMLAGCLAGAAIVLLVSNWLRSSSEAELARAQQLRSASAARLHNVGIERQELARFGPRFAQLQAGGLIGDENRLAWIEAIRTSQASRKLVSANYEIEPQQPVSGELALLTGDYHLRASRMRLELGMVHELDMFNLLGDLRAAGPFTVQECRIRRNDVPQEAVGVARLTGNCTLVWLTLGAPPQPIVAPASQGMP